MKSRLLFPIVFIGCALCLAPLSARVPLRLRAETTRTIYFTAVDSKGVALTDLTPADLSVKEGGKDYPVASLKAATGPVQAALLDDDGGTGLHQAGVVRFLTATSGHAEYAISLLNPQPLKLTNYISDVEGLKVAISKIVERGRIQQDGVQMIEAVSWASKELQQRKAPRPTILVITNGGEPAESDVGTYILNDLRASGASLNIVYINGVPFGKVMADGPKQSGGLLLPANSTQGIGDQVSRIASNLMHQYALTYTLPEGTKLSDRLELKTSRKDVTLIAPTRIPNK